MRIFLSLLLCFSSLAAFGSENAVVVINAESSSSKLVGNFYVHHRDIPSDNVIYLAGIPNREVIPVDDFRKLIIGPILKTIENRNLGNQISYIIYSSDFPTIIDVSADRTKALADPENTKRVNNGRMFSPMVSINSATYFYQSVLSQDVSYLSLKGNTYSRSNASQLLTNPFVDDYGRKFKSALSKAGSGDFKQATEILEEQAKEHPLQLAVLYWLARCYAWQGDTEQSVKWLKNCIAVGWCSREYVRADVAFKKIKDELAFKKCLALIPNLPMRGGPAIGFRSSYFWGPNGMINSTIDQGNRYMLSTILAVNRNKGNSEKETLAYLKRSIDSDGSQPKGAFYFTSTKDIRTRTRRKGFDEAADELNALGFRTVIVPAVLPKFKNDIAGMSIGAPNFKLEQASISFLPGAICENLTSFGGRLISASQTKLTSFLRFGAAGSSGTIVEPFAVQAKFPHPRIHVHYVRGCTLAEAYYQSVDGPFQLLIVGDALCQPWAKIPRIKLAGDILSDQPISGDMKFNISSDNTPAAIRALEMYIDGRLVRQIRASKIGGLTIDTNTMPDGYHEFRFVPVSASPISTRGSLVAGVEINNQNQKVELKSSTLVSKINDSIEFNVKSDGATSVLLLHNKRIIKQIEGDSLVAKVPAFFFGRGTVEVEAVATFENSAIRSRPLEIQITGPVSSSIPQIKKTGKRKQAAKKQPAKKAPR